MKTTVIGTGYVGLVSGTCLAEVGNDVLCLDVDPAKIKILEEGGIPIFEPGLQEMVRRNVAAGRLHFTTDVECALHFGSVQLVAVGTEVRHCLADELRLSSAVNRIQPSTIRTRSCSSPNGRNFAAPILTI